MLKFLKMFKRTLIFSLILTLLCFMGTPSMAQSKKTKKADTEENSTTSSSDDNENQGDEGEAAPEISKKKSKSASEEGDEEEVKPKKKGKNRVEIEASFNSDNINLVPTGDEGIILFYESDERSKDGQKKWIFVKYNTDFKEVARTEYMASKKVNFVKAIYDKSRKMVYILLAVPVNTGMANGYSKEVEMVQYNVRKNKCNSVTGLLPTPTTITDMYMSQSTVYFGGFSNPTQKEICGRTILTLMTCGIYYCAVGGDNAVKFHPMLYYADFKGKQIASFPISQNDNKGFVSNISRGIDSSNVAISFCKQATKKDLFVQYVKLMGQGGKEGREYEIPAKQGIGLNEVAVSTLGDKSILAVGSYSKYGENIKGFTRKKLKHGHITDGLLTTGFYISKLVKGKQKFLRCYPFKNFFKDADSGNKDVDYSTSQEVLFHDPIETKEGIIMIGEFYYEHYHTETYYDGKAWHTRQVFDGYVFTKALVACFDPENGDMLWNNVFPINFYTPPYGLYPHTTVMSNPDDEDIVIVYNDGKSLRSKVVNNGKMQNGTFTAAINTGKETDKVVSTSGSNVEYWFDNYFIAYGYESIKTKGKLIGGRRQVFYFNKIEYR